MTKCPNLILYGCDKEVALSVRFVGPIEEFTTEKRTTRYRVVQLNGQMTVPLVCLTKAEAKGLRDGLVIDGCVPLNEVQLTALISLLEEVKSGGHVPAEEDDTGGDTA